MKHTPYSTYSQPVPATDASAETDVSPEGANFPSSPSLTDPLDHLEAEANLKDAHAAPSEAIELRMVQALQVELEQQKALTLRALADLDNYRKRALKEKEDLRKFAIAGLIEALLPILDNFELGLKNIPAEAPSSFVQGFQMVQDHLLQTLKDFGLSSVEPVNEAFNPNTQECIAHLPHETVPESHVIQTVRKGYTLQDKLLRSASVLVSRGPDRGSKEAQTVA